MSDVNNNQSKKFIYRADIDGLRALSVLSVILYHINPKWLPGGFIGVDIFFVISGFLITSIIYKQLMLNTFSFKVFYNRRIKRILPTFFVVVISTICVGKVVLAPEDFKNLVSSAESSTLFIQNMYFAYNAGGYFANNELIPLLHTWSLAVEEQYYFFWPIVLLLFLWLGINKRNTVYILVLTCVTAFILTTILPNYSYTFSKLNYYWLPSRFGELLIGSITAIVMYNKITIRSRPFLSYFGMGMILISLIFVDGSKYFPGLNAFWACVGTALIIYNNAESHLQKFLSQKYIVKIGLLSYSMYLWHWPILSFVRYSNPFNQQNNLLSPLQIVLILLSILILSTLTYEYVEKTIRKNSNGLYSSLAFYFFIPISIILLVSLSTNRLQKDYVFSADDISQTTYINEFSCSDNNLPCFIGAGSDESVAILGDSHAIHFEQFLTRLSNDYDLKINDFTRPGCPPAVPIDIQKIRLQSHCAIRDKLFERALDNIHTIILAGRWDYYLYESYDNTIKNTFGIIPDYQKYMSKFIEKLRNLNKTVIVVTQIPKYDMDFKRNFSLNLDRNFNLDLNYKKSNTLIKEITQKSNTFLLDFDPIFCASKKCSPYDLKQNHLYYDDDHLSRFGSNWLYENFRNSFEFKKLLIEMNINNRD